MKSLKCVGYSRYSDLDMHKNCEYLIEKCPHVELSFKKVVPVSKHSDSESKTDDMQNVVGCTIFE